MREEIGRRILEIDDAMAELWVALDAGLLRWESLKFEYEMGTLDGDEDAILDAFDYLLGRVRFVDGLVVNSRTGELLARARASSSSAA